MIHELKKNIWLRFSVRGILILTTLCAIALWSAYEFLTPEPERIEYHSSLPMGMFGWWPQWGSEGPTTEHHPLYYANGGANAPYVEYWDNSDDGRIDQRQQSIGEKLVTSTDTNGDGFFDKEIWEYRSFNSNWRPNIVYSRNIYKPVPVILKPSDFRKQLSKSLGSD